MHLVATNRLGSRPYRLMRSSDLNRNTAGFTLLEVLVVTVLVAVAFFSVSQTTVLILKRSLLAIELATAQDRASRFNASLTLAAKTAVTWGIYPDLASYYNDGQGNLTPEGNLLVCYSTNFTGNNILYLFLYDPATRTLKRFENNINTARMNLDGVTPVNSTLFNQKMGLVQDHFHMVVQNTEFTFSTYATPLRMR